MKKYVYIILSLLWMALIFTFSGRTATESTAESMFVTEKLLRIFIDNPSPALVDGFENFVRKLAHFTEYSILGILLYLTLRSFGVSRKNSAFAVAISFLYATSDEIHQYFVPGRACRWYDICIDTLGAGFGYIVCRILSYFKIKFSASSVDV